MKYFSKIKIVIMCLFVTMLTSQVHAHESRPMFVEINETGPNAFIVNWKIPPSASNIAPAEIIMPESCQGQGSIQGSNIAKHQFFKCDNNLSGLDIKIHWPQYNPSISTLFRFERLTGEVRSAIISPDTLVWTVPNKEDGAAIASEYFGLGIEHILLGFDHLLFVACLIFIAGSVKRILITATGFTISHSITLALAALDVVRLPIAAVEATIALSILFLAFEIARVYLSKSQQSEYLNTLTWRYPVVVASAFGLLHGFGFASVLNDIGLPQTELPTALLFFNVGVEFGQIVFILACITLVKVLATLRKEKTQDVNFTQADTANQSQSLAMINSMPYSAVVITIYAIGLLSAYWLIDRAMPLF